MNSFEQNKEDIYRISEIQFERISIAEKIIGHSANIEEIEDWYKSYDFIDDRLNETFIDVHNAAATGNNEKLKIFSEQILPSLQIEDTRNKIALQYGAEYILKQILELDNESGDDKPELKDITTPYIASSTTKIESMIADCYDRELSQSDMEKIFLASEMLILSSGIDLHGVPDYEFYNNWKIITRVQAFKLLNLNMELLPDIWEASAESKKLYFDTINTFYTFGISDNYYRFEQLANSIGFTDENYDSISNRNYWLGGYLNKLKDSFLGNEKIKRNILDDVDIYPSRKKGIMHESLWLLDMMMLREFMGLDYSITSSTSNADRPLVGKPKRNHGYDAVIESPDEDTKIIRAQLKSGKLTKRTKEYNPAITVFIEKDFKPEDLDAVEAKLNAYEKAIENNFSEESFEECLEHILPTAIEAINHYRSIRPLSSIALTAIRNKIPIVLRTDSIETLRLAKANNIPIINNQAPTLNRKQRRKLEVLEARKAANNQTLIRRNPRYR